jgi:hypothetical protein
MDNKQPGSNQDKESQETLSLSAIEVEEEKYFEEAAAEMNADAKDWTRLTSLALPTR